METTVRISGMSCGHCVRAVESALKKLPGVKAVSVAVGQAVIQTDDPLDEAQLHSAIREEGFDIVRG